MKLILDTHIFLWFFEGNTTLKHEHRLMINNQLNQKFVSIVSLYEMSIKLAIGKLELNYTLENYFEKLKEHDITILPISQKHLAAYQNIPLFPNHKDPFDRLIIATAQSENLSLISNDGNFYLYKEFVNIIL